MTTERNKKLMAAAMRNLSSTMLAQVIIIGAVAVEAGYAVRVLPPCDHEDTVAGPDGEWWWCGECGAFRVATGTWVQPTERMQ